jgi:hypothetical protein
VFLSLLLYVLLSNREGTKVSSIKCRLPQQAVTEVQMRLQEKRGGQRDAGTHMM